MVDSVSSSEMIQYTTRFAVRWTILRSSLPILKNTMQRGQRQLPPKDNITPYQGNKHFYSFLCHLN
jgi:hypothetical protein